MVDVDVLHEGFQLRALLDLVFAHLLRHLMTSASAKEETEVNLVDSNPGTRYCTKIKYQTQETEVFQDLGKLPRK